MQEGGDRRRHTRKPVSMQVCYRTLDTFFYDYALNISLGGIFIKTENPLARGSEVEIEFQAPGSPRSFRTKGTVVRVVFPESASPEPPGMGIEFEKLNEDDKELINMLWEKSTGHGRL